MRSAQLAQLRPHMTNFFSVTCVLLLCQLCPWHRYTADVYIVLVHNLMTKLVLTFKVYHLKGWWLSVEYNMLLCLYMAMLDCASHISRIDRQLHCSCHHVVLSSRCLTVCPLPRMQWYTAISATSTCLSCRFELPEGMQGDNSQGIA